MRFAPADETETKMEISVVPYPTADGDAEAKANYTIPMGADSGYAVRNVTNEASGLTVKILVNILDDFCRGLRPEFSAEDMTDEQAYRDVPQLQDRVYDPCPQAGRRAVLAEPAQILSQSAFARLRGRYHRDGKGF